jgi:hypothetical protein
MGNPNQPRRVNVSREWLEANKSRSNAELAAEWGVSKTTVGTYYRAAGIKKTPSYHQREKIQLPARCDRQRRNIVMAEWRRVSRAWAERAEGEG